MKTRSFVVILALLLLLALGGGVLVLLDDGGETSVGQEGVESPAVDDEGDETSPPDVARVDEPTVVVRGPRVEGPGPHLLAVDTSEADAGDEVEETRRALLATVDWKAVGASARKLRRAAASSAAMQLADRDPAPEDVDTVHAELVRLAELVEPLREPLGLHGYSAVLQHPLVHANVLSALLAAEGEALSVEQSGEIDERLSAQLERLARDREDWDHDERPMEALYGEAMHADELRRWFHAALSVRQRRAVRPGDGHRITRLDPFSPAAEFLGQAHDLMFYGERIEAEWIAMEIEERLQIPDRRDQFQVAAERWLAELPESYRRPPLRDWNHEQFLHPDAQVLSWTAAEVALRAEIERAVELDGARRHMLRHFPVIWRFTRLPREE